jgi:hypothetical protein
VAGVGYTKGVLDKLPLTRDDAVSRIDFLLSRFDGLLHPELAAAKRQLQDQWIDRRLRTMAGEDLLHRLHLEYRVGRWGAAGQPTRTLLRPHYQPLFDPVAVRSALAVGILARATDRLLERLLLRFAPALLEIPLGTTRFTFERSGPRPGDEEGYRRREPIAGTVDRRLHGDAWKWDVGGVLAKPFIARILEDPHADALWDVVDRDRVERIFASQELYSHVLPLWRLVSVASLVSNRWLRDPEPETPITVSDRLPWSDLRRRILRRVDLARDRLDSGTPPRVDVLLDRLDKRTRQASETLKFPPDRVAAFLQAATVRIGGTEVSLEALLTDAGARAQAWEASAEGHEGEPVTDSARTRLILDGIERALLPSMPAHPERGS